MSERGRRTVQRSLHLFRVLFASSFCFTWLVWFVLSPCMVLQDTNFLQHCLSFVMHLFKNTWMCFTGIAEKCQHGAAFTRCQCGICVLSLNLPMCWRSHLLPPISSAPDLWKCTPSSTFCRETSLKAQIPVIYPHVPKDFAVFLCHL